MPEQKKYLECEKLWVFVVLIFVAGFYGAYTMLLRGGVFCNAQTGNMVLMGMAFGQGQWSKGVYYLFPIGIYLLGVMISELIPKYVRRLGVRWDTLLIFLEIVGVIVVGFVPLTANHKISQFVIMLRYARLGLRQVGQGSLGFRTILDHKELRNSPGL